MTSQLNNEIEEFWNDKKAQIAELKLPEPARRKRQFLLAGLAATAGSLFTLGFDWFQSRKIKDKMDNLKSDFISFTETEHSFTKNQLTVDKDIIKMIRIRENSTLQALDELECKTDAIIMNIIQSNKVRKFMKRVDAILQPLNHGSRTGSISPEVFNLNDVTDMIQKNERLKSSIYATNPSWIYSTSKITVAEASDNTDSITVHLILSIPVIKSDSLHTFYQSKQTGFEANGSCWTLDIPEMTYTDKIKTPQGEKTEFFRLDDSTCSGELIKFCTMDISHEEKNNDTTTNSQLVSCLSDRHIEHCKLIPIECQDNLVYNQNGVMIKSNSEVTGILRVVSNSKKTREWDPSSSQSKTKWFGWETFSHIQYKDGIVYSSDYDSTITAFTREDIDKWKSLLMKATSKRLNYTKIVTDIKKTMEDQQTSQDWFKGESHQNSRDAMLLVSMSGLLAGATILIFYQNQDKLKKLTKTIRSSTVYSKLKLITQKTQDGENSEKEDEDEGATEEEDKKKTTSKFPNLYQSATKN